MLTKTLEKLLEALKAFPDGGTAKQIAASIGAPPLTTSQRLGELFWAGHVVRERAEKVRRISTEYVYRIAPPKIVSPPQQWQPETRIAERMIKDHVT